LKIRDPQSRAQVARKIREEVFLDQVKEKKAALVVVEVEVLTHPENLVRVRVAGKSGELLGLKAR